MQPFYNSTPDLADAAILRATMRTQGYLFVRNLIPRRAIDELYGEILAICTQAGWSDATGRAQGEARIEGSVHFWIVYDAIQRLESFHTLAHRPELLSIMSDLTEETPFVHPRNIGRITFPNAAQHTTPAHQDFVHVQGAAATYTAWFPLRDCPQQLGSLLVLAGSHRDGILPVHQADGAGGLGIDTSPLPQEWHGSDFAAGDVLIFHSHTVHKALPNQTADQLRISVDYRYQGLSQPVVEDGLLPHYNRLAWPEIYADWQSTEYQYYWRDLNIETVPRDRSYQENAAPAKS